MGVPQLPTAPPAAGGRRRARGRSRLLATVPVLCAGALLSACGHPQEVIQSGTVGSNAQVGDVLLRNVYVEDPPQESYPGGSDATVRLTLINQAGRPDTLTAVSTDVADHVEIVVGCDGTPRTVSSLDLPARIDAASPPNRPGPNDAGYALRLVDLRTGILQGGSVPIEFTFRNAGSITLPTPVGTGRAGTSPPPPTCGNEG